MWIEDTSAAPQTVLSGQGYCLTRATSGSQGKKYQVWLMRLQTTTEVSPRQIFPMAALFFLYYPLPITEPRKDKLFSECCAASNLSRLGAVVTEAEANGNTYPQPAAIYDKNITTIGNAPDGAATSLAGGWAWRNSSSRWRRQVTLRSVAGDAQGAGRDRAAERSGECSGRCLFSELLDAIGQHVHLDRGGCPQRRRVAIVQLLVDQPRL
jgi:hypothetical protein